MCLIVACGSLSEWTRVVTCPPRREYVSYGYAWGFIDSFCALRVVADGTFPRSIVDRLHDQKTDGTFKAPVQRPVPRYRGSDFSYEDLGTFNVPNRPAYAPRTQCVQYVPTCHLPLKDPGKDPYGVVDSWRVPRPVGCQIPGSAVTSPHLRSPHGPK